MTKNLKDSILKKIDQERIQPRSRWIFVLHNVLFWTLFAIGVLLGAAGFGVILYALNADDFDLMAELSGSGTSLFMSLLPIFWICFFAIFLVLSVIGIQHTKKGYKWPISRFLGLNLLIGVILGSALYAMGGGAKLDRIFDTSVPGYQSFIQKQMERWFRPEEGRLAGEIMEVDDMVGVFILREADGTQWEVDYTEADIRLRTREPEMVPVRVMGTMLSENQFSAAIVAPFHQFEAERIQHKIDAGDISRRELERFRRQIQARMEGLSPQEQWEMRKQIREEFREKFGFYPPGKE